LFAAIGVAMIAGGVSIYAVRANRPPPVEPSRPGDDLVVRALAEYDTFYNDKSLSSLRAALAVAPEHPRANAYMVLFGGASPADQAKAVATADRTIATLPAKSRDRTLLEAASMLVEKGPRAAREILTPAIVSRDRELAFWAAELDYRAANYVAARDAYKACSRTPKPSSRQDSAMCRRPPQHTVNAPRRSAKAGKRPHVTPAIGPTCVARISTPTSRASLGSYHSHSRVGSSLCVDERWRTPAQAAPEACKHHAQRIVCTQTNTSRERVRSSTAGTRAGRAASFNTRSRDEAAVRSVRE
jgi:hypothetical protein